MLRLVSLALYPLMDTTEARYGEVARIIVETGNWIVPQIDYNVPFWGKPPLAFWASAVSIDWFWNSEFFLRLPHFLAGVAVLPLIWLMAVALGFTRNQADIAVVIPATTIGFLITAGAVMTDMFLCLSITMVMLGFWRGWHGERRYLIIMYAGIGLGLLAKGPIVIVLAGIAIFPWILFVHGPKHMWLMIFKRLHLATGIALTLLIAAPWYYLMEQNSPGFFEYFVIGEHFQRFIESGWQGDLYGSGHAHARGTIWIYWFLFSFPWSLLLLVAVSRPLFRFEIKSLIPQDPALSFLVLWMCSPMLLFTLAGNILPAYILPGLPAIGLLIIKTYQPEVISRGRMLLLVGPVLLLAIFANLSFSANDLYSDKELLSAGINSEHDLYYYKRRTLSGQYYSNGHAKLVEKFPDQEAFYLVVQNNVKLAEIDKFCSLRSSNQKRRLYFCRHDKTT
jgi:4-amino-4-deoxy-L-arabinose transferase-like glycosyltransferase